MTDDELKALVASLSVGHEEMRQTQKEITEQMKLNIKETKLNIEETKLLTEQMKLTNEETKRVSEQMKRTDEQLKENAAQFKENAAQFKENAEQFKRTDEQFRRTDEQLKRTDEKLERIGILQANIAQNQGDVTEEFFFQSLLKDNRLGNIAFDDISYNQGKHRGNIQEQYDLMMTNGDVVGIVEVKYKAHKNDLDKLDRKMRNFKKLFPIYASYKQYGAIASFHVSDEVKDEALKRGYFVLQRSGDLVHTECTENPTVL